MVHAGTLLKRPVDVTASADASRASGYAVRVLRAGPAALAAYAGFAAGLQTTPAQSPAWVEGWTTHSGESCLIAFVSENGHDIMALPLEVLPMRGVRIARFMGGSHANGNFATVDPGFATAADPSAMERLVKALGAALTGVDILHLERQAAADGGVANPFALLQHRPSPNLALASDLSGGFEALVDRLSGKRKRKKWRAQKRKFESAGGYRVVEALTPAEVKRLLAAFFAMKAARFAGKGIEDVFAPAPVRAFFEALFVSALAASDKPFRLFGLEVGGALRAVNGCSVAGKRLVCEFGAIADDDLAIASPGDFLFFETIRDAASRGFTLFDFSVGDEPYKRQWCDVEIRQFDSVFPLTAKGRLLALQLNGAARVKRMVKENLFLWSLVKRWRARNATPPPAAAED